jgi:hypothetical protein
MYVEQVRGKISHEPSKHPALDVGVAIYVTRSTDGQFEDGIGCERGLRRPVDFGPVQGEDEDEINTRGYEFALAGLVCGAARSMGDPQNAHRPDFRDAEPRVPVLLVSGLIRGHLR